MAESARALFATAIGDAEQTALLLDAAGIPLAGSYVDDRGRDISAEIGAALSAPTAGTAIGAFEVAEPDPFATVAGATGVVATEPPPQAPRARTAPPEEV